MPSRSRRVNLLPCPAKLHSDTVRIDRYDEQRTQTRFLRVVRPPTEPRRLRYRPPPRPPADDEVRPSELRGQEFWPAAATRAVDRRVRVGRPRGRFNAHGGTLSYGRRRGGSEG